MLSRLYPGEAMTLARRPSMRRGMKRDEAAAFGYPRER
jgi:hypothetical protein